MTSSDAIGHSASQPHDREKRTKASRACDECRRKKIRCDVEQDGSLCSSCQRMGAVCTFSRVQLKRGPTKRVRSNSDLAQVYQPKSQLPGISALLNWAPNGNPQMAPNGINVPSPMLAPHTPNSPQVHAMSPGPMPHSHHQVAPAPHPNPPVQPRRPSLPNSERPQINMSALAEMATYPGNAPKPHGPRTFGNSHHRHSINLGHINISQPVQSGLEDIDPMALNQYYCFWHPIFPVLPDTYSELASLIREAPTQGHWLAAVLNGTATAVPIEPANSGPARTVQLMVLLFVYLRTIEPTWLGAAAANAMTIARDGTMVGHRLHCITAALDQIHAATFGTQPLLPIMQNMSVAEYLKTHLWYDMKGKHIPPQSEVPYDDIVNAINTLVAIHDPESLPQLEQMYVVLAPTPLGGLVQRVLQLTSRQN